MFHMIARRRGQALVTAAQDTVLWGLSLPRGSVVHDIRGRISLLETSNFGRQTATAYGFEIQLVPVPDPDAGTAYATLWDQLIPKDSDSDVLDLDTVAADTTPFFEPGEVNWNEVIDVGKRPEKLYGRYRFLSMADGMVATFRDDTNAAIEYSAGDRFGVQVKKSYRVSQPSVLMCAVASPALDDTVAAQQSMLAENEWSRVKYAKQMLEQAMISLIGLEEAGAETPWEDQIDLMQLHLEPDLFEQTGDAFVAGQFFTIHDFKIGHSVVGELGLKTLSLGR